MSGNRCSLLTTRLLTMAQPFAFGLLQREMPRSLLVCARHNSCERASRRYPFRPGSLSPRQSLHTEGQLDSNSPFSWRLDRSCIEHDSRIPSMTSIDNLALRNVRCVPRSVRRNNVLQMERYCGHTHHPPGSMPVAEEHKTAPSASVTEIRANCVFALVHAHHRNLEYRSGRSILRRCSNSESCTGLLPEFLKPQFSIPCVFGINATCFPSGDQRTLVSSQSP